jgi:hypothetical protein
VYSVTGPCLYKADQGPRFPGSTPTPVVLCVMCYVLCVMWYLYDAQERECCMLYAVRVGVRITTCDIYLAYVCHMSYTLSPDSPTSYLMPYAIGYPMSYAGISYALCSTPHMPLPPLPSLHWVRGKAAQEAGGRRQEAGGVRCEV